MNKHTKYNHSEKGKARYARYEAKRKAKNRHVKYNESPKGIERRSRFSIGLKTGRLAELQQYLRELVRIS